MNRRDEEEVYDLSVLPDDVFTYCGDPFFHLIHTLVGNDIVEILRIQSINSTQSFINTKDPLAIFQLNIPELSCIKDRLYFKLSNGDLVIKVGIKNGFKNLNSLFKLKQNEQQAKMSGNVNIDNRLYDIMNRTPVLKSLFFYYDQLQQDNTVIEKSFLSYLIDNVTSNLSTSKNQYRYNNCVKRFAVCLYILGGKMAYEFARLNITRALPSLPTLYKIISDTNLKIIEGQFRFDELQHYLNELGTEFGFVSEDCTGVVQKIIYNEITKSFIGFSTPLSNGIPRINHFQTDSLEELETWFSTVDKASLLNVHMFQPVSSSHPNSSPAFLLGAYGVNNQCTSIEILKRWNYIYDECCKRQIRVIGFSSGMNILTL